MNAAFNGDEEADNEMNQIFQANENNIYIFGYKDDDYNAVYIINDVYYKIDMQNRKAEILTNANNPTLYAEVSGFVQGIKDIKTLFMGKNIEDFDQERIDDDNWRIYNLEGIFTNELECYYWKGNEDNPSDVLFTYDSNQEIGKLQMYLENSEIVNDKITGRIVKIRQDD